MNSAKNLGICDGWDEKNEVERKETLEKMEDIIFNNPHNIKLQMMLGQQIMARLSNKPLSKELDPIFVALVEHIVGKAKAS